MIKYSTNMANFSEYSFIAFLISFLLLLNNAMCVHFTFDSFNPHSSLGNKQNPYSPLFVFEGDASASNGTIQLTRTEFNSVGRVSYANPVHLWDKNTGRIARFQTRFSFAVKSLGALPGDGLAFFIAPFESKIPQNSYGGYLGLVSRETALDPHKNRFVAVEFDTFGNDWDSISSSHVGIDVNSIASATQRQWGASFLNGTIGHAFITYDSYNKELSVILSTEENARIITEVSFSYLIDLRSFLPEWVRLGFSAATGDLVETHDIISWSFRSSLA